MSLLPDSRGGEEEEEEVKTRDEMFVELQTHGVGLVLVKGKQYVRLGSRLL